MIRVVYKCSSPIRILIFYLSRIRVPGVKKATDPWSRIRNTDKNKLTDDYVGGLAAEFGGYPLEARLLPDLGGGVDVLHGEDGTQPEQQDLRQRRNKLNSEY